MKYNDTIGAIIIGILLTLCLSSCMTNRHGELTTKGINFIALHCKGETKTEISFKDSLVYRDTTIQLPPDSSWYRLYLACDSGKVKIQGVTTKAGKKVYTAFNLKNNVLTSVCKIDSSEVTAKWLENHKSKNTKSSEKIVIKEPCDKDHISGTQWAFIRIGQWLLGFILFQVLIRWLSIYPVLKWLKILYVFKF